MKKLTYKPGKGNVNNLDPEGYVRYNGQRKYEKPHRTESGACISIAVL